MADYPPAALRLVAALRKLPGIGPALLSALPFTFSPHHPAQLKTSPTPSKRQESRFNPAPNAASFLKRVSVKFAGIKTGTPLSCVLSSMPPMF